MKRVAVLCTTRCNTGCQHCRSNSVPKGEDMSLDVIRTLKKSIRNYRDQVEVVFTGGGEPLMWVNLPEAINILRDVPKIVFSMVTSGCLDKNDERFFILKEALKQADGEILIDHSFNLFSPTFPQRLEFTLPFILLEGAYRVTYIKMVGGISREDDFIHFHFSRTRELMEKSLEQAIGRCSRLVCLSAKEYQPSTVHASLKKETAVFKYWLTRKAFLTPTAYTSYALGFTNKTVIGHGSFVNINGRAKQFLSATAKNAYYNFGLGFDCGVLGKALDLSTDGRFSLCPCEDFPPFPVGIAGDDLEKVSQIKKNIALKVIDVQRQELLSQGFDPCGDCSKKAWEIFYKTR